MKKSEVRKKALEFCKENNIKAFPVEIIKACNKIQTGIFICALVGLCYTIFRGIRK